MNNRQGCFTGLFKLLMLDVVFDWLQDRFGFGRGCSCSGCGCGFILLILFIVLALQVIFGTLCLYLILGLFWGALYSLLYELSPGSFAGAMLYQAEGSVLTVFNYFSMVTLTTLGYGDITPQTQAAGALCQIEAIAGQFYIAVVVAWLVGNVVADRQRQ